jgi:MFS family permease
VLVLQESEYSQAGSERMPEQSNNDVEIKRNYKHNFIVNFIDGTMFWFGASFFAYRTILPVYISNLTKNELVIALLSIIVATGWMLPQLFTVNWVRRLPVKKFAPVTVGLWAERLPILLLVFAAWLGTRSIKASLILSLIFITWHIVGAGVIAVGWQDMLAKIFPLNRRGRFFGLTNFGGTATGVVGASIVAWLLAKYPFPYSYMWAFLTGAVLVFISWFFLRMTREPAVYSPGAAAEKKVEWAQLADIVKRDDNFRRFLITQIFLGGGNMSIGFFAVFAIQQWNLPDSRAGAFTVAMLVGQALSNLVFGWLADRYGHKVNLEICMLATLISLGAAIFASAADWFYAVFFFTGVSSAGFILSGIMIIFEFCTPDIRPVYIGLNNTFNGIIAIIMPFLGGVFAKSYGYRTMFSVAFAVCLLGSVLLRFWVTEPRSKNT